MMKTIKAAGFSALPYHNQIPTMGEWGWVLGVNRDRLNEDTLKKHVLKFDFAELQTRYINRDAMISMTHFGKGVLDGKGVDDILINTEINPVLHRYYQSGTWGMY